MNFSISVPIGAYHPFLPYCLKSLRAQKAPLRVALLDASGDDRVKEIADAFDDIIAYRRHGPDNGQSAAILEGWANTDGDVLGWLNADDILFPNALSEAKGAFEKDPQCDVIYGHSTILDDDNAMIGYHWAVEPPSQRLFESGIISQPSCFFKRAAYEKIGGLNEDLHYTMDWDLFIRLYKSGAQFSFLDAPLSQVLWADDTKTASFNSQRRQELRNIIAEHAPKEKQRKIFRSFAIHNMLGRLRPDFIKNSVTRLLVRGRRSIYGLAADGVIAENAKLHLLHYDDVPKSGIVINCNNPDHISQITIDGAPQKFSPHDAGIKLNFATPLAEEIPVEINVETKVSQSLHVQSCNWV